MLESLINDPDKPISGFNAIRFKNGEITFKGGWGLHAGTNKRFRIASISKFVMSMVVARLAADHKLDLDADVSQWLGFHLRHPKFPTKPITLTHLLSHTSTLRDATAYSIPLPHKIQEFFEPEPFGLRMGPTLGQSWPLLASFLPTAI